MLAIFSFFTTEANAQSLEFENQSSCTVAVQLTASHNNCKDYCVTGLIFLAPNSTTTIPLNCSVPGFGPIRYRRIDLTDGAATATVGLSCGLPSSATYQDCTGDTRTVVMNSPRSATIF